MTMEELLRRDVYKRGGEFQDLIKTFAPFFVEKEGRLVNSCYQTEQILRRTFGVSLPGETIVIPKMVLSKDVADIRCSQNPRYAKVYFDREYDDQGYPVESFELFQGLENYCMFVKMGIPIYVFDNHSHALFAWQEAQEAGNVVAGETVLIHLDDHSDLCEGQKNFSPMSRKQVKEAIAEGVVDIADFIDPAFTSGMIDEMYFCHSVPTLNLNDGGKDAYLGEEGRVIKKLRDAEKFFDITSQTLGNPEYLSNLLLKIKTEGKKIILDIDFDLFFSERAKMLLPTLPSIARYADVVTCATSPSYIQQEPAIRMVRDFVQAI